MFVALRDIRFAKGRFALMGSVVALITLLIVLLSGLTAGLADQSTSAVRNLPADRVAFGTSGGGEVEESYDDSTVTRDQLDTWSDPSGWAEPVGITRTRMETPEDESTAVALFGVVPEGRLAPEELPRGEYLAVGEELAEDHDLSEGSPVAVNGRELEVAAVVSDEYYSHTPAVWTDVRTWRGIDPRVRHAEGAHAPVASVIDRKSVV